MTEREWRIAGELRPWQDDAIVQWKRAKRCGVIEAATGTGKTMVALVAMELLAAESGDQARVAVVVSSIEMAAQWRMNLIDKLGVGADEITEWHTAAPRTTSAPGKVVIAVINSARTRLPPLIRTWRSAGCPTLIIVDECHHAASPENRRIFEAPAHQRIGLSATIERQDREESVVYDGLGPVCYRYELLDALNDGVVSPITSINLYVDLTASERVRYAEHRAAIDRDLALLSRELLESGNSVPNLDVNELRRLAMDGNTRAAGLLRLIRDQSALVKDASNRERCVAAIAPWLTATTHSVLVFHESIP